MKTITKKTIFPAFIFLICLLAGTTSFKAAEKIKPAGNKPANCNVDFLFSSSSTIAFGAIEDSQTDQTNTSFTGWSGTFSYNSGSVIFTIQFPATHPSGTLRLYGITDLIDIKTVAQNSTAINFLVDSSPDCGEAYYVSFY